MGRLIVEESLRDRIHVFKDRAKAGEILGQKLLPYKKTDALVLAIPSGGVPVAAEVAVLLGLSLDLVLVRKIQIPWDTEAGFGAMDPDGEVIFNTALLDRLGWITEEEIKEQIDKTKDILQNRDRIFRSGRPFPELQNRTVLLVDDGLASGYTMLSAIRFIKKKNPGKIIAAVPTGSMKTVEIITSEVDELVCLNIRGGFSFAVADAYVYWHDLTDKEVISCMEKFR